MFVTSVNFIHPSIIVFIHSPHITFTVFVALIMVWQQGQIYRLLWLFVIAPPLLECVPTPTAVYAVVRHISISRNSSCDNSHSSKLSAGAVCAKPYFSERVTIKPCASASFANWRLWYVPLRLVS